MRDQLLLSIQRLVSRLGATSFCADICRWYGHSRLDDVHRWISFFDAKEIEEAESKVVIGGAYRSRSVLSNLLFDKHTSAVVSTQTESNILPTDSGLQKYFEERPLLLVPDNGTSYYDQELIKIYVPVLDYSTRIVLWGRRRHVLEKSLVGISTGYRNAMRLICGNTVPSPRPSNKDFDTLFASGINNGILKTLEGEPHEEYPCMPELWWR